MTADTFVRCDGPADARPLVLVHGVGLDHTMYDLVVDDLTASGRRVVRYDLLGHGASSAPDGAGSLDDFVDQLLDVLDAQDLTSPDIAGLSIGGLITKAFAMRHPQRGAKLALLNTVFGRTEAQKSGNQARLVAAENDGLRVIADLAIDRWFSPDWQQRHPRRVAAVRHRIESNDLAGYLKAYRVFIDGDPLDDTAVGSITTPTLVMTGELDPGSTPEMTFRLAAAVANGQALVLPGLHHIPPIENPSAFSSALIDFLDQEIS